MQKRETIDGDNSTYSCDHLSDLYRGRQIETANIVNKKQN